MIKEFTGLCNRFEYGEKIHMNWVSTTAFHKMTNCCYKRSLKPSRCWCHPSSWDGARCSPQQSVLCCLTLSLNKWHSKNAAKCHHSWCLHTEGNSRPWGSRSEVKWKRYPISSRSRSVRVRSSPQSIFDTHRTLPGAGVNTCAYTVQCEDQLPNSWVRACLKNDIHFSYVKSSVICHS